MWTRICRRQLFDSLIFVLAAVHVYDLCLTLYSALLQLQLRGHLRHLLPSWRHWRLLSCAQVVRVRWRGWWLAAGAFLLHSWMRLVESTTACWRGQQLLRLREQWTLTTRYLTLLWAEDGVVLCPDWLDSSDRRRRHNQLRIPERLRGPDRLSSVEELLVRRNGRQKLM